MLSLRQRILKGFFWSYLDSFGVYFIRFAFSIAIARALSPSDYGVIGMIVIFISVGQMLMESGFAMALIQKKDANEEDFSTVFWFNLIVAFIVYLVLFMSAELIADFYNEAILVTITKIASIPIILNSLCVVQITILSKEMNFKRQAIIHFISTIFSGTTGIILAYKGFAIWALVIQTLVGNLISTICFWIYSSWRPKFIFSLKSFVILINYGYKIFLSGLSDIVFTKIYYPLIGKIYSASQLGFYTNANRFYEVFIKQPTNAYIQVTFPAFASIQNQMDRFIKNYLRIYRLLAFIIFPLVSILIIIPKPFVAFFLTEKWSPVVPLMKTFFIEGFYFPLYMLNLSTINAMGRNDISLKVEILKKVSTVVSIFLAIQFGIQALIIGQVVSSFIAFIVSSFVTMKIYRINFFKQLYELFPIITLTITCVLVNQLIIDNFIKSNIMLLIIKGSSIPILYILLSIIFNKNILKEFIMIFEKYIPEKIINIIN